MRPLVAVVAVTVSLLVFSQVGLGATVTRGPYLQSGTPTSMIVKWRTNVPTDSKVQHGTVVTTLGVSVQNPDVTTDHEVSLPGLLPDTKYFYSIGTTTQVLAGGDSTHFFVTPPPVGMAKPTENGTSQSYNVRSAIN